MRDRNAFEKEEATAFIKPKAKIPLGSTLSNSTARLVRRARLCRDQLARLAT